MITASVRKWMVCARGAVAALSTSTIAIGLTCQTACPIAGGGSITLLVSGADGAGFSLTLIAVIGGADQALWGWPNQLAAGL